MSEAENFTSLYPIPHLQPTSICEYVFICKIVFYICSWFLDLSNMMFTVPSPATGSSYALPQDLVLLWTNICISSVNACAVFCRVVRWTQALLLARQTIFLSYIATFSIRPVFLTIQQCGSYYFNLCFSDLDALTLAKPCCLFLSHNQGVSVCQSAISNHLMGFNFLSLGFVIICLVLCYKSFARIS